MGLSGVLAARAAPTNACTGGRGACICINSALPHLPLKDGQCLPTISTPHVMECTPSPPSHTHHHTTAFSHHCAHRAAAQLFVGTHCFAAFSNVLRDGRKKNPIKTIHRFDVEPVEGGVRCVSAAGWLWGPTVWPELGLHALFWPRRYAPLCCFCASAQQIRAATYADATQPQPTPSALPAAPGWQWRAVVSCTSKCGTWQARCWRWGLVGWTRSASSNC